MTAYEVAREKMRALDRRLALAARRRPVLVRPSVAHREADDVTHEPRARVARAPVSPSTALRRFVRNEFREAQAKKKAIAR